MHCRCSVVQCRAAWLCTHVSCCCTVVPCDCVLTELLGNVAVHCCTVWLKSFVVWLYTDARCCCTICALMCCVVAVSVLCSIGTFDMQRSATRHTRVAASCTCARLRAAREPGSLPVWKLYGTSASAWKSNKKRFRWPLRSAAKFCCASFRSVSRCLISNHSHRFRYGSYRISKQDQPDDRFHIASRHHIRL